MPGLVSGLGAAPLLSIYSQRALPRESCNKPVARKIPFREVACSLDALLQLRGVLDATLPRDIASRTSSIKNANCGSTNEDHNRCTHLERQGQHMHKRMSLLEDMTAHSFEPDSSNSAFADLPPRSVHSAVDSFLSCHQEHMTAV
eukprot:2955010-Pleurochrysis_carterae.AAC.3